MNQKFSKRINALVDLAPGPYDEVWDLCCDLGKIGQCYCQKYSPKEIHFVDQVASIVKKLELQNASYIPKEINFFIHHKPAQNLKINNINKKLFILAGIGSETIIKILDNFQKQNLMHHDFLISSHKYPQKIRSYLIDNKFKLFKEQLISEDHHFYEMLLVSHLANKEISMTGLEMWDFKNPKHLSYFDRQINYYNIKAKNGDVLAKQLLEKYHELKT